MLLHFSLTVIDSQETLYLLLGLVGMLIVAVTK